MEKQLQELEGKLRTLEFTRKKTAELMTSNNIDAISRHEDSIMSKIKAIHTLKESIIEQKFTVKLKLLKLPPSYQSFQSRSLMGYSKTGFLSGTSLKRKSILQL